MRGPLRFVAAISFMLCSIARPTAAQSVLLVRPSVDDPMLIDAFHRVEAELRIHHFEPQLRELAAGTSLGALAEGTHALAAIALVLRSGETTLDLWLRDRASGATSLRTLEAGTGADAASLIAVRAVDLLRASVGEFDPAMTSVEPSEPTPSPATPTPATTATTASPPPPSAAAAATSSAPPPTPESQTATPLATIEVEACALRASANFGFAAGATLGFYYRPIRRLALGVSIALPLTAAEVDTPSGSARVHQAFAVAEARWALLRVRSFQLAPLIGLGAYALQAHGDPLAPLVARSGVTASFLIEAGVRAEFALFGPVALGAALRALALVPRTGVAVGSHSSFIDLPAFEATLGLAIGL
ncbi:MAG TPA: hypothetical protein VHZ95_12235 [Polyangiales bacterium]|nr:hypothetical protein [Polyangiales bacterium]